MTVPDPIRLSLIMLLLAGLGCSIKTVPEGVAVKVLPNTSIESFSAAKVRVYRIFESHAETFYCACAYTERTVKANHCSFSSTKFKNRSRRTEMEHVVPAHAFGQSFLAWREGHPTCVNGKGLSFKGRRCAERVSQAFRRMSADLYNLRPVVGALNALRQNYAMAELEGEPRDFGVCDVEISRRKFEPRVAIRGDIARIYFYMDAAYPGRGVIARSQRKLFLAWHRSDPVSEEELRFAKAVEAVQGNENPFVTRGVLPSWANTK